MQDDMDGINPQTKQCPYCERTINKSSHRCPHCQQSLAGLEQHHWEQSSPSIELKEAIAPKAVPGKMQIARVLVLIFLLLSFVSIITFQVLPSMIDAIDRPEPLFDQDASRYPDPPRHRATQYPPVSTETSSLRMVGSNEQAGKPEFATRNALPGPLALTENNPTTEQEKSSGRESEIEKRARTVYTQVLKDLRKNGAATKDKIYLKSGAEIRGTVLEQADTHIKVRYKGLTTTIEKKKIERIESSTAEEVERELHELALAQAKKIMRADLVRHGKEWITREKKAERIRAAGTEPDKEKIVARMDVRTKAARPKAPVQYDSKHFEGKTWEEKLEMIFALAREEGSKTIDFFGGSLWLEIIEALPPDADAESAPIAFEARARNLDVTQISDASGSPIKAAGSADADVEAEVDVVDLNDLTSLTGKALIVAKQIELPRIDLGLLLLPANRKAGFNADLAAKDGYLVINGFRFEGTAYSLSGDGIIQIATPPERSPIELSLLVLLKESPTVTDQALAKAGAAVIVDALVSSQAELPIKVTGTLEKPEVQFDTSSLASMTK